MPLSTGGHRKPVSIVLKDGTPVDNANPLPVNAIVTVGSINQGLQTVETTTPLGASATFSGTTQDCEDYSGFCVSAHLQAGGVGTNVDVIIEYSHDNGVTWREVDRANFILAAGASDEFNEVYTPSRRYARVRLVNNTANALAATEVIVVRRPIP